jgi:ATP-dependent Clp protease ATP-binding subunit ClpC
VHKDNPMFERYTEKARRVVFFARYEASQFGSPYIETEHLLLGLLREDKALTNRFLRSHGGVEAIRKKIEEHTVVREKVSTSVDLPVSNECKRVLIYAAEEGEHLSHKHIGTEHLLLGLLREEKCFATQILNEHGVRLSAVREELARTLPEEPAAVSHGFVLLSDFSVYLTRMAREGQLLPLVGRESELEQTAHVLGRSAKNNVVLVGEPGVGKRTIVEGLAQRVANNVAPAAFLEDKLFVALDLSLIMAAAQHGARPKEFLKTVTHELITDGANTIFFFDELYALLTAEPAGGVHEAVTLLKQALLSGQVRCIAAATPEEHRAAMKKARWLERCFRAVKVEPATEAEALTILKGIKDRFEKFHSVEYTEEALVSAVVYSNRYIKDRYLPDKAIDLIDDAGAYVKMKLEKVALPEEVIEGKKRLKFVARRQEMAITNHEFEKARFYADEERKQREDLRQLYQKYNIQDAHIGTVTVEHIEEMLARWTGMPVSSIRQAPSSPESITHEQRPDAAVRDKKQRKRKSP